MKRVYLDTSAFFKIFFSGEEASQVVERIVSLADDNKIQIVISEWVVNEVLAAIEKKVQKRKASNEDAHDTIFAMANFLEDRYPRRTVVSYAINEDVVINSRRVIESLHLSSAADALHVLIANRARCTYFISADKELNASITVNRLGITPIDVHEPNDTNKFFDEVKQ